MKSCRVLVTMFAAACWVGLLLPDARAEFEYTTNGGAITITNYTGPGGDVTIPGMIDGLPVTGIGKSAFLGCGSLTSVTIPGSVTSIEIPRFGDCVGLTTISVDPASPRYSSVDGVLFDKGQTSLIRCPAGKSGSYAIPGGVIGIGVNAFWGCFRLTNVAIPDTVTSIGGCAFSGCSNLTGVAIPGSVTFIGGGAFVNCGSLTGVTIPSSVTKIYDSAFDDCRKLTTISVDPANPSYSSADGVLFDKGRTTLIRCPAGKVGAYTIPDGVTSIGDSAFVNCGSLTIVTIPGSVTSIGDSAFRGCSGLTSVTIPASGTKIDRFAFYGCTALTNAYFKAYGGGDAGDARRRPRVLPSKRQ